jgi:hypothetical protein
MLTSTTRAVQFGSLLAISAAIVYVGVTSKIAMGPSQANLEGDSAGQAEVLYIPKVGRVIRHAEQTPDERMQLADNSGSVDLTGVGDSSTLKAGGQANQAANTVQRASGEGCVILPKVGTRC